MSRGATTTQQRDRRAAHSWLDVGARYLYMLYAAADDLAIYYAIYAAQCDGDSGDNDDDDVCVHHPSKPFTQPDR